MKEKLTWLITTKLGWFIICFILAGIFLISSDYFNIDWLKYIGYGFLGYPLILLIILMTYAFFINPYNDYKERQGKSKDSSGN